MLPFINVHREMLLGFNLVIIAEYSALKLLIVATEVGNVLKIDNVTLIF